MSDITEHPYGSPESQEPLEETTIDVRNMAMFCHLSGFAKYCPIPFANILAPLIFWQWKKDQHPFIDDQGKEALNFQISITIYAFVSFVLIFCAIGFPLLILLAILDLVFMVIAGLKANAGERYRYPLTIRLVR